MRLEADAVRRYAGSHQRIGDIAGAGLGEGPVEADAAVRRRQAPHHDGCPRPGAGVLVTAFASVARASAPIAALSSVKNTMEICSCIPAPRSVGDWQAARAVSNGAANIDLRSTVFSWVDRRNGRMWTDRRRRVPTSRQRACG